MNKVKFKKHAIRRTCTKTYKTYSTYKPYLKDDFDGHCAYCNLKDEWIKPMPFEVEHFIPKSLCEANDREDLVTDYRNLMYSCPQCNRLKGNKYEGTIPENDILNPCFYNPSEVDYNDIFYRDEKGRIYSDDKLGRKMIETLKLYYPSKQMAWFLDELFDILKCIKMKYDKEEDVAKKEILKTVMDKTELALYRNRNEFVNRYIHNN